MKYKYNKWNKRKLEYFNKPIMKAEEVNEWSWWVLLGIFVLMGIMGILKVLGKI